MKKLLAIIIIVIVVAAIFGCTNFLRHIGEKECASALLTQEYSASELAEARGYMIASDLALKQYQSKKTKLPKIIGS